MKRTLLAALAAFSFFPTMACADQVAADSNKLAVESLIDCYETSQFNATHNTWQWDRQRKTWTDIGWGVREADPLARPFAHSMLVNVAAGVLLNIAFRRLAEQPTPTGRFVRRVLRFTVIGYPILLTQNMRLLAGAGGR